METPSSTSPELYFLNGGGEMGELTRNYDWSKTPLGPPDRWPQSLRMTVSMILKSRFPMFLWWGQDLIQFYNDAYRPSLGNEGKHPTALGQNGKDCWPEIWDIIYPLIQQVFKGGSTWSEDQLIPIYRNGKIEDVYWTFGYSPIVGASGTVEGVLVVCTETTEKIQAQKAVEESEKRFKIMAEGTDILIATSDEKGLETYFNKAWLEYTGRPMEALQNLGWMDLVHMDDRQAFLDIFLPSREKKMPWSAEFRMLNRQGEYRWLLASGQVLNNANCTFSGCISSCIDITARKVAEERLMKSEQEVRSLVESAPFPIGVYVGREMRIKMANQSLMDAWGKGSDIIGKLYRDVLPEVEDQDVFNQLDQVFTSGIPFEIKNQRIDLMVSGKMRPFYFNYCFTPLFDASGKVYGVMNTAADVTDLNMAHLKILESENKLRNTILQAPIAMCIFMGPNHVVELANARMIELWGKPVEAFLNKPLFEGLYEAKGQGFEELLDSVYNTGKTVTADAVPVTLPRNGKIELVYVNILYQAYRDSNGHIKGILAVAVDVTAQVIAHKKIEELVSLRTKDLEEANNKLQKSNAELAQFAYIASHDLQEPLRKISIFSELLENHIDNKLDDQSRNYLKKINNSSVRMNKLIRDVLSYSELAKGNNAFELVDLNKVMEAIKTDYELLIEQKGAIIECEPLPVIEAIPLQMAQLFGNMLGNALKFSKNDIRPVLKISVEKKPGQLPGKSNIGPQAGFYQIRLSDNGIGIKPEYTGQIFNIFQRLHHKSAFEGTGIGLAICRKIVLNHRGDINADGSDESGAVFNILLPEKQPQDNN